MFNGLIKLEEHLRLHSRITKVGHILILTCVFTAFLPAMVNSFIHVLMYSYYGLAALGPSVTKYLWWKKYLTILQLIQFTTALVLGINGIRSGCDFPLWMQYALVIYMVSFIVLFGNFYAKAYIAKVRPDFNIIGETISKWIIRPLLQSPECQ